MTFIAWPEIEGFHNIRKFIRIDPNDWFRTHELLHGTGTVTYKAKVKLHGTNAAIQCHADGSIIAQSRTSLLSVENDNAGFARWVKSHEDAWKADQFGLRKNIIFFGEWIGPGIQKNVAVSEIPKKVFAVFAAKPMVAGTALILGTITVDGKVVENPDFAYADDLVVEPDALTAMLRGMPDTYVLPWHKKIDINWRQTDEDLTKRTAEINDWVMAVEACDPWVEKTFGVKGTGEGLVFYPTSKPHLGWETFQNLVFKAKGEAHKNIKTAAPAQVNPEVAASVDAFVELVLTTARLEQEATSVGGFDLKLTGKFVAWCLADVQKETQDEMTASKLDWKQVQKPLSDKARAWYLTKSR